MQRKLDVEETPAELIFQHTDPVWREKANYICQGIVESQDGQPMREQLWARKLEADQFEICCIPYFLYDLALGDVVLLDEADLVSEVVRRSGRSVYRIWLGASLFDRRRISRDLSKLGALQEWRTPNLCAVDAANAAISKPVMRYLADGESRGKFKFEGGLIYRDEIR